MTFTKKEIGYIAASLNVFKREMESVGQKETAQEAEQLIDRVLALSPRPASKTRDRSLDLIKQQRKDIEELTYACQLLMRTNKELLDELQRSREPRQGMDQGA